MITYPQLYALFIIVAAGLLLMTFVSIASSRVAHREYDRGNPQGCILSEVIGIGFMLVIAAFLWWFAGAYPFGG